VQDYRKLKVWEKAHQLTLSVYECTLRFPREELYGLTAQMRRSAYSIPTNIAEGAGRAGNADFARFLQMAFGSACELEYQLLLARDLKYLGRETYEELSGRATEIKKMLGALLDKVRKEPLAAAAKA